MYLLCRRISKFRDVILVGFQTFLLWHIWKLFFWNSIFWAYFKWFHDRFGFSGKKSLKKSEIIQWNLTYIPVWYQFLALLSRHPSSRQRYQLKYLTYHTWYAYSDGGGGWPVVQLGPRGARPSDRAAQKPSAQAQLDPGPHRATRRRAGHHGE